MSADFAREIDAARAEVAAIREGLREALAGWRDAMSDCFEADLPESLARLRELLGGTKP